LEYYSWPQSNLSLAGERDVFEKVALQVLVIAQTAFDHQATAHACRTAQLAEETARQLGCSKEEQHMVWLAALLHDVGKISIPDAIRHKAGPLTHDEWAVMRLHPGIGQRILEQVGGVFQEVATLVGAHHERWDGMGYPLGLEGEEIPLGARILSVVDSFDAMTSCRSYREPLSIAQARAELQRCRGSQYDPRAVEAFLLILDDQELVFSVPLVLP
jgi:putative nucleotidyltransferase with HDIG domain